MPSPRLVEYFQPGGDDGPSPFSAYAESQGAFPSVPRSLRSVPIPGSFPVAPLQDSSEWLEDRELDIEQDSNPGHSQQQHNVREVKKTYDPEVNTWSQTAISKTKGTVACAIITALAVVTVVLLVIFVINDDKDDERSMPPPAVPKNLPIPTRAELRRAVDAVLSGNELESIEQQYGNIATWDVSLIEDFSEIFSVGRNPKSQLFNANLAQWNVSRGVSFFAMFRGATSFNADLSNWRMSSATTIRQMFLDASSFRQNLCPWLDDLAPAVTTTQAFEGTVCPLMEVSGNRTSTTPGPMCFDCFPIVSATPTATDRTPPTTTPSRTPTLCSGCNEGTESTSMPTSFINRTCFATTLELQDAVDAYLAEPSGALTAATYGHPIGTWCVSSVTNFADLFSADRNPIAVTFNEDISQWDMSNAESLFSMFAGAREFNQPLGNWTFSKGELAVDVVF